MSNSKTRVNLKEAIRHLDTLPAMPAIAQKILSLNLESDEGQRLMLKHIEKDPQIAAKIIGLANTPFFGASKRVSSIVDAALLLGITRVKSITIGIAVMSSLIKQPSGKLDVQGLWLHSLAVSLAMRSISRVMPRNMRPLDDEIFLAGLLHDIGYLALNHLDPQRSDELQTSLAMYKDRSSTDIEAELLDINHCELASELGRFWGLPEAIIAVLRYHHDPENESAVASQPLVNLASLAIKILSSFGTPEYTVPEISNEEWLALGIEPAKADEIIELVVTQAEEAQQTSGSFP